MGDKKIQYYIKRKFEKKILLKEISQETGISISLLSMYENGQLTNGMGGNKEKLYRDFIDEYRKWR